MSGSKLFSGDAVPTGIVYASKPMTAAEADELRKAFMRKHSHITPVTKPINRQYVVAGS